MLYIGEGVVCFKEHARQQLKISAIRFCSCAVIDTQFSNIKEVDCELDDVLDQSAHEYKPMA